MAFDTDTRNKLRSAVEQCRKLLCGTYDKLGGEITAQLQEYYGIQPTGEIASIDDLDLDAAGQEKAQVLRDLIAHYAATDSGSGSEKVVRARAVQRLVLEQAFTVVNRLAALRMAEERDILPACISGGMDSDGFQLYEQTAGTDMGDRFDRYRSYLFCLFDELTLDLAPLFDRFSPQGLIFPRERALLDLLDLLNSDEVNHLWGEDETIGWVYQYWNSKEERTAMRKASAAPRNSRELAVRNQFFTPRYVVQFLTDNTLGRIWYEMCRGETRLLDQCEYLVRRPHEIFMLDAEEYVSEECGDWVKEVRQGNFAAAEFEAGWEEITAVALAIDGYIVAEKMRLGDVHDYVRERGERAIEQGQVEDATLLDQWLLLFSIQRGIIREGLIFNNEDYARAARQVWEAWVIAAKAEACDPVSPTELDRLISSREKLADSLAFLGEERLESALPEWVEQAWASDLSQLDVEAKAEGRLVALALPDSTFPEILDDDDFDPRKDRRLKDIVEAIREDLSNDDLEKLAVVWAALADFVANEDPKNSDDETWGALWTHFCRLARINTAALKIQELSQEELLNKPVFVPPRPFKDPREIRLLDPACGSMHFGLYAFDLYETIYEEAWNRGLLPEGDFESFEDFQRQVPRLIIEHNIHGVDIDPRAAQIAGLSLWLRAQRSWKGQSVRPGDRPVVERSNIVCAEPMPGDEQQLAAFTKELHPVIAHMVRTTFAKMELAGEAGSLLKIEEEVSTIVREAREAWEKIGKAEGEMFSAAELAASDQRTGVQQELALGEFTLEDLAAVSAVEFFDQAEEEIYRLLERYAEGAGEGSYQRRLFAEDAARGFAFIDLCRKRYDAVVMNPPFGDPPRPMFELLKRSYCSAQFDLAPAFVDRGIQLLASNGRHGVISTRIPLFTIAYQDWREDLFGERSLLCLVIDLGLGVLDGAMVETTAYVAQKGTDASQSPSTFFASATDRDFDSAFGDVEGLRIIKLHVFRSIPGFPFPYWLHADFLKTFRKLPAFSPTSGSVVQGLGTTDDYRFCRLRIEVAPQRLTNYDRAKEAATNWVPYVKGERFAPYFDDYSTVVNWEADGREVKEFNRMRYGSASRNVKSESNYGLAGLVFPRRTKRFAPRYYPPGMIFSVGGQSIFPIGSATSALGYFSASAVSMLTKAMLGSIEMNPQFEVGVIKRIPFPDGDLPNELGECSDAAVRVVPSILQFDETTFFSTRPLIGLPGTSLEECIRQTELEISLQRESINQLHSRVERSTASILELSTQAIDDASIDFDLDREEFRQLFERERAGNAFLSWLVGAVFGRWDIRCATGDRQPHELPDPFDPLPVCPPGMLQNDEGLPAEPSDVRDDYPLRITWPGILVDDEGHDEDIVSRVREALTVIWKDRVEAIEQESCEILGVRTLRDYFAESKAGGKFFKDHLSRYSKSRRQAPIYWPLSTESGSYTLWLYYHRLTDQTLFASVSDFVEPKIEEVTARFQSLSDKADDRSAKEQKEWEQLEMFIGELNAFRDELLRIAHLPWKPNLNDGVMITAAPLWKLFRLTTWRNKLKKCWETLENGDYDWAHLAYTIWPGRVLDTCRTDRSIAIAHDVEDLFWEEDDKGKWKPRKPDEEEVEKAMKEGRLLVNPLEKDKG